jgi:hypothetical protein
VSDEKAPRADESVRPRLRIRSPSELLAGSWLLALSAFALWAGRGLDAGTLRAMGPGMIPRGVAVAIAGVGLLLVGLSLLKDGASLGRWPLRGPFFVTLAVVTFALTIRTVGLAVAGPLVVVVGGAASPESRPRELVIFGLVMTAFCVALFRFVLSLPIPVLIIPGVIYL